MNAIELMREQYALAHQLFESTMADVTAPVAASVPAGTIQHIGSIAAHAIMSEDMMTSMAMGVAPLFRGSDWFGRLGVPETQIPQNSDAWAAGIHLDVDAFKQYTAEVFARTMNWLGTVDEASLNREVDGPFGKTTVLRLTGGVSLYHLAEHTGEIAAIKGVQGLKGLPF